MTQKEALDILKMGHNVYLTGSAGSGKTHLLNLYIDHLRKYDVDIGITASTGIAATHMGGVTIHSWSGLGIRDNLTEQDLEVLEQRQFLWKRFESVKVLIIDEVSMLHHFRLDLVDQVLRGFKRSSEPFGGIQVVLCGDFFQLPPISRPGEPEPHFIYKSQAWKDLDLKVCYLHEQFRQTDDAALSVLNAIRSNSVDEDTYEHLKARHNATLAHPVKPTRLHTHNVDVDRINNDELSGLTGPLKTYTMTSRGSKPIVEALKKSCLAPEFLTLKKGAQVMFVKNNFDAGYVNGTLGTVVDFEAAGPVVETLKGKRIVASPVAWTVAEDGKVKAEISQVPLRLAWAITVHKSQGMSLDAVEVDLSRSFERGMGYVALSRVRTLSGLRLLGINQMALEVNEEVLEFDRILKERSEDAVEELKGFKREEITEIQEEFMKRISPPTKEKKVKKSTKEETKELVLSGLSLAEIASRRDVTVGTVVGHIEELLEADSMLDIDHLRPDGKRFLKIQVAFGKTKEKHGDKLAPVHALLNKDIGSEEPYTYEEIRIARLFLGK